MGCKYNSSIKSLISLYKSCPFYKLEFSFLLIQQPFYVSDMIFFLTRSLVINCHVSNRNKDTYSCLDYTGTMQRKSHQFNRVTLYLDIFVALGQSALNDTLNMVKSVPFSKHDNLFHQGLSFL